MHRSRKPSFARLEVALRAANGIVLNAARSLGVEAAQLRHWIEQDGKLQQLRAEIHEENLDLAELQLRRKIVAGDIRAIKFARRFYVSHAPALQPHAMEPWEVELLKEVFEARARRVPSKDGEN